MRTLPRLLSKTKLMRGYRCHKCIYMTIHHPDLEQPITPELQALFDQGNIVGAAARDYYPGGILIDNKPWDFTGALTKTKELLAANTPLIYEAAFSYMGCYARADIIQYSPDSKRWSIYEVKSSTKVKPEHYDDVGLQAWIMAKSGLPIEAIHVVHLNTDCVYPDLSNLFTEVDVTQEIRSRYLDIKPTLRDIFDVIKQPNIPDVDIGPYCKQPTECGFVNHCWQEAAIPQPSVFNLPQIKDKKWDLYYSGILQLDDPRLSDLNDIQERMVHCYQTKQRYINPQGIKDAMREWQFPLVFLDFETINPAIPRYDGTRPFGQTPFQFSVHIWQHPNADIVHHEFLHDNPEDPRPMLIPALIDACGTEGSIVAYFGQFEGDRITELADYSPSHRDTLLSLVERIVDPLPIIRSHVYDNAFCGSFSLKYVAPALLGETASYRGMQVANGGDAQRAFELLIAPATPDTQRQSIRQALLDYCKQDTYVMIELTKWLFEQAEQHSA